MFDRALWSRNFVMVNLCVTFASFTNFAYIYILPVHVLRIGGTNADVGLMGVLMMLVGLAAGLPLMLLASVTIAFGGTVYSQYLQAEVLLRVPDVRRGVANSSIMIFQDVGQGLGAAVFGLTSEHLGYPFTFAAAAAASFLSIPAYLLERGGKGRS